MFSLSPLHCKRDPFPFSIVRTPYLFCNMPSKIFYAALRAEIPRISRTCIGPGNIKSYAKYDDIQNDETRRYHIQNQTMSLCKIYARYFDIFIYYFHPNVLNF